MLEIIIKITDLNSSETIKTDFEISAKKAFSKYFLRARILCCTFHLGQALFRKIQSHGLRNNYNINLNIKKFFKALISLTFVKVDELKLTFFALRNSNSFPLELSTFYGYFFETNIGDERVEANS